MKTVKETDGSGMASGDIIPAGKPYMAEREKEEKGEYKGVKHTKE